MGKDGERYGRALTPGTSGPWIQAPRARKRGNKITSSSNDAKNTLTDIDKTDNFDPEGESGGLVNLSRGKFMLRRQKTMESWGALYKDWTKRSMLDELLNDQEDKGTYLNKT